MAAGLPLSFHLFHSVWMCCIHFDDNTDTHERKNLRTLCGVVERERSIRYRTFKFSSVQSGPFISINTNNVDCFLSVTSNDGNPDNYALADSRMGEKDNSSFPFFSKNSKEIISIWLYQPNECGTHERLQNLRSIPTFSRWTKCSNF